MPVETPSHDLPAGCLEVHGKTYMRSADGGLMPLELVKPERLLEDQMVRKIIGFAGELSAQIERFKAHTIDDATAFLAILAEKYGVTHRGGKKGNVTFTTYDGLMRFEVRIAETLTFGPELQTAKELIDECINEWSQDTNGAIRMLINEAFKVDQAGRIDRNAILKLRNVPITDDRWLSAMDAISASIRVTAVKQQFYFKTRPTPEAGWESITIDLASAAAPRPALAAE